MRKRNKDKAWCVIGKSILGGIGLGLAAYTGLILVALILGV